LVNQNTVWDSM